jgi:HSP20 family protein
MEIRRMLDDLQRTEPTTPGEYVPPLDVTETADQFELVMDVPAVSAPLVHVVIKDGTVFVAGDKAAPGYPTDRVLFHRAERSFGRFARAVRLPGAIDASRARASVSAGELRVTIPKIADRRGTEIVVPIEEL